MLIAHYNSEGTRSVPKAALLRHLVIDVPKIGDALEIVKGIDIYLKKNNHRGTEEHIVFNVLNYLHFSLFLCVSALKNILFEII